MINYGITPSGVKIKRLQEIVQENAQNLVDTFGPITTAPGSVFGQINGVYAKPAADVWEQVANIYYGLNPETAEGVLLDYVVAFNGLTRLKALPTEVLVGLNGTLNTLVPKGVIVKSSYTNKTFKTNTDKIISPVDQTIIYLYFNDWQSDSEYYFNLKKGLMTEYYTASTFIQPDRDACLTTLVDNITSNSICDATYLGQGKIKLVPKSSLFTLEVLSPSGILYYIPVVSSSEELGAIPSAIGSIDIIVTPEPGLDNVLNFEEGVPGRGIETDAELRLRRKISLQKPGGGNLEAIVARIKNDVPGVISCSGFENVEDTIDPATPHRTPHSIELVITGGASNDIASTLWACKGGGIQTVSANVPPTYGTTIDSNGDIQTLYWTRPIVVYGWVTATISLYSEEIFPADGLDLIKQALFAYGSTFTIGLNIIPFRFSPAILSVPGVEDAVILVARTALPDDSPSFGSTPVLIGENELAVFSLDRIFCEFLS